MNYQHLAQNQRYQIAKLNEAGMSCRKIAELTFCHHSTIARELKRNRHGNNYRGRHAHSMAVRRRQHSSSRVRITPETWALVEEHLRQDWSPEQVVGRGIVSISIERSWIAADAGPGSGQYANAAIDGWRNVQHRHQAALGSRLPR